MNAIFNLSKSAYQVTLNGVVTQIGGRSSWGTRAELRDWLEDYGYELRSDLSVVEACAA